MHRPAVSRPIFTALMLYLLLVPFQTVHSSEVTTHRDWGHKCEQPKGINREICFIFQQLSEKKSGKPVVGITIAYPRKETNPALVITLPLGVHIPAGVRLKIDQNGETTPAPFIHCVSSGCQAKVKLNNKLLGMMKRGNKLNLTFLNNRRKALTVAMSLSGFTAAINSLKK